MYFLFDKYFNVQYQTFLEGIDVPFNDAGCYTRWLIPIVSVYRRPCSFEVKTERRRSRKMASPLEYLTAIEMFYFYLYAQPKGEVAFFYMPIFSFFEAKCASRRRCQTTAECCRHDGGCIVAE